MPTSRQNRPRSDAVVKPHTSLAIRVADHIRREMILRCRPGDRLPSERELAEQLDVSRRTVRSALARLGDEGLLRPERGHGHVVTRPPDRLPDTTALLLPVAAANMLSSPFFREVFISLSQGMQQADRHMLSLFGAGRHLLQPSGSGSWDPMLRVVDSLVSFEVFNEQVIALAGRLYPVVTLDVRMPLPGISSVTFDHPASIRMAFKHLADLGHRRIGFCGRTGGYADPAVAARYRAYRDAFDWLSMGFDERWVLSADAQATARAMAGRWLRLPRAVRPTALIMVDLFWALTPLWMAEGVRIPGELSVVNVGVVNIWSEHVYHAWHATRVGPWEALPRQGLMPPFANYPAELTLMRPTTVELPAMQMGQEAVNEIVRLLAAPGPAPRHVVLTPRFVPGNTTAVPAAGG
ncbi:MAG: hypothetical protein BIFFINMI_01080 [Phycisphaerae bacterium]|nr:hypothetical protein [Phycisphaerae bacterium]